MAERETRAHTVGPWKVDEQKDPKDGRVLHRHIVAREPLGNLDAPVCRMYPSANGEDDLPNARLIASAPTLAARVEELESLLAITATMLDLEGTCHAESGDEKRMRYVAPIRGQVAKARAALPHGAK